MQADQEGLVRKGGLEPPRVAPPDPKSGEVNQNLVDWCGFDAHRKFPVADLVTIPKCKPIGQVADMSLCAAVQSGAAWCERGDSNPHGFPRQDLNLVRLPIPPLSHNLDYTNRLEFFRGNSAGHNTRC